MKYKKYLKMILDIPDISCLLWHKKCPQAYLEICKINVMESVNIYVWVEVCSFFFQVETIFV